MRRNLYRGYSSFEFQRTKSFRLSDVELVKMDLLNHIYTRRGERVMMPNFGTQIPDMAFEPLDEITLDILRSDLETVFRYDPRVELLNLVITPDYDNNSVLAQATLKYVELNITDTMDFNIEFDSGTR